MEILLCLCEVYILILRPSLIYVFSIIALFEPDSGSAVGGNPILAKMSAIRLFH